MKIKLISDIHVEFHRDSGIEFAKTLPIEDIDCLIIAGDFGTRTTFAEPLKILADKVKHIIYVPGNHEYYGSSLQQMNDVLLDMSTQVENLHMLINSSVKIEGINFVGSTCWFEPTADVVLHMHNSNDFKMIQGLNVDSLARLHADCQQFLARNVSTDDIVITHYLPLDQSVDPKWRGSALNCFFVTDCQHLIDSREPRMWCHGHTHASKDFLWGKTRIICNPLGYPHEGGYQFNENLVIEV
jgi:Icc-related predicted phosphoesterase